MDQKTANKILLETESGYDSIAEKFSQTRKHFWRGLEFLKDYTGAGDKVLDFGCGNGRLLELIGEKENFQYWGVDVSEKLIEIAKKTYGENNQIHFSKIYPVKSSEAGPPAAEFNRVNPIQTTLPFEDNFFNTCYSIAVFHHFPSRKYREQWAREMHRLTASGGHVVITVWYLWQRKYLVNILKNWRSKLLGKSSLDFNDCMISFTDNSGRKFQRFHRAFTKKELEKLFANAGFQIEKCEVPDGRNIVLVAKKQ